MIMYFQCMPRRNLEHLATVAFLAMVGWATPGLTQRTSGVALRRGLVITSSVRIAPNVYRLTAPSSMDSALIIVRGDDVTGGEIRGNRVVQGMEALMLVRSDSLRIWNNVFSFNSGVGIGLYRSSDNVIMHNHVDYNVRGYSHGFYRRGQDSADLLIYEQS